MIFLHVLCSRDTHPLRMAEPSAVNNQRIETGDRKPYDIGAAKALKKRCCVIDLDHDKGCDEHQNNDSGSLSDQILLGSGSCCSRFSISPSSSQRLLIAGR